MPFEMETSRTADAAKLAVLWRDRDKKQPGGGGGSGVPDHFVEDVFEGGILPEVIPPPAGPPTTNPDGTTTPGVVPEPTLVDHKTVYTDAKDDQLKSLFAAVQDLRAAFASPTRPGAPGPTDALHPLAEDGGGPDENPFATQGPFFGPDLQTSLGDIRAVTHGDAVVFGDAGMTQATQVLRDAEMSILDVLIDFREAVYGRFGGPGLTESVSEWVNDNIASDEVPGLSWSMFEAIREFHRRLTDILNVIETQFAPRLESLEDRVKKQEGGMSTLTRFYQDLEQRVRNIELGPGTE
ncbi:hypothetical protein [Aureimonas sp. SK2]|uniref:hypothetical protein n=1 Tax=Aureimonas sp. SK2 TaxID=3015992 RepID=UPI002443C074|nr:hypothetical protein [Aureimonas sp. SK2]